MESLHRVGGDALVARIIDSFLASTEERIRRAEAAMREQDLREVERATHSLKSTAGLLGARDLQEMAESIEILAAAGSAEPVPALLRRLGVLFPKVRLALEAERDGR